MRNLFTKLRKLLLLFVPFQFKVTVGKGFTKNGYIHLVQNGKIIIGERVHINSGLKANPVFGLQRTSLICNKGATLRIGNDVGISNVTIFCEEGVSIGDRTLLGSGVKIWDIDFHSIDYQNRMQVGDRGLSAPVEIGQDCFIGAGCIILKGVTIEDRVVIGAGSVVTKNIKSGEIWAGNPARLIKTNSNELCVSSIENVKPN